jgi:hypothetical protein
LNIQFPFVRVRQCQYYLPGPKDRIEKDQKEKGYVRLAGTAFLSKLNASSVF